MRKNLKILIIFIITLCFLINFSYAEDDICKVSLSSDKTTLQAGDKIKLDISLSNIKTPDGILAVGGFLEYDPNVFEFVYVNNDEIKKELQEVAEVEDFEILYIGDLQNENVIPWFLIAIQGDTGGTIAILGSSLSDSQIAEQKIAQIEMKVKSGVQNTNTTVNLKNIETYDATQTRYSLTKSSSINYAISGSSSSTDNGSYYANKDDDDVQVSGISQKENVAKEDAPYTGAEDVIIPSILIAIIGMIAFIKYLKYRDI